MARSSYIYLALSADYKPLAAFTVKYECQNWLQTVDGKLAKWVTRLPDGRSAGTCPTYEAVAFSEA